MIDMKLQFKIEEVKFSFSSSVFYSNNEILESCLILGVCLVESESGGNTAKVSEFPNLSSSYGIFQINSKEWCRKGRKGGECGVKCEDFLDEDIRDDIKCAKVIYNRNGFNGKSFCYQLAKKGLSVGNFKCNVFLKNLKR